jgi:hypothetical protein
MPNNIRKFESRVWVGGDCSSLYRTILNMNTGEYVTYSTTMWQGCSYDGKTHHWKGKWSDPNWGVEHFSSRHFSVEKFTPIKGVNFRNIRRNSTFLK